MKHQQQGRPAKTPPPTSDQLKLYAKMLTPLELPWATYPLGESRHRCPQCSITHPHKRDNTLCIRINSDGSGTGLCHRCEFKPCSGKRLNLDLTAIPKLSQSQARETLSDRGTSIWNECSPITAENIGGQYLLSRHCVLPPSDGHLRFHPSLPHGITNHVGAALVGLITDPITRVPVSLHFTWITPTGKAAIEPPRRTLGGHRSKGVIRLYPDEYVSTGLGIAEGIETALSLAHRMRPVWSCVNKANLAKLPVLAGIECLSIAVDKDKDGGGAKAAMHCGNRWAQAGASVLWIEPFTGDINDLVQGVLNND